MLDSDKSLPFRRHIEELRNTILNCGMIIGLGFILAFSFHQHIIPLLTHHWENHSPSTVKEIKLFQISNSGSQSQLFKLPPGALVVKSKNSFLEIPPYLYRLEEHGLLEYQTVVSDKLLFLGPLEGITLIFKISFWIGLTVTAPFWCWRLFKFISPGLHSHEKIILYPFLIGSCICIALGVALAYGVTIPLANHYLQAFNAALGQNAWSFAHYVDYTLLIFLGHMIAAEICLLLLILVHFGLFTHEWLISKRKYAIVLSLVLAAILTPPDILTQFALAIPLMVLYELAIIYAKCRFSIMQKKEPPLI